jgi:large subunit ribosomal protein L4
MQSEGKTAELSKRLKAFGLKKAVLIDANVDDKFNRDSKDQKRSNLQLGSI